MKTYHFLTLPNNRNYGAKKMTLAQQAANAYIRAGLSVVPIRADGSKALALAAGERKTYESRLATEAEINQWFGGSAPLGIAILGGAISGNLCCIDFDYKAEINFPKWCELIPQELLEAVVVNQTPRPGYHVVYRVDGLIPPTCKLATMPNGITTKGPTIETAIETRAQGAYFIAPGSPASTHLSGKTWQWLRGRRLSQVQTVSQQDHEVMLSAARSLTYVEPPKARRDTNGLAPGTDFNQRGSWPAILEPHGWRALCVRGDVTYWQRPGKEKTGISATTGHCKADDGQPLLHVFSSNAAPLESEKTYDKFGAFARLNHGDFFAAAAQLREEGYGVKIEPATPAPAPVQPPTPDDPIDILAARLRPMVAAVVAAMLRDASETLANFLESETPP